MRLSASGFLRPCLASEEGVELGEMLRGGASDVQLLEAIRAAVRSKPLQHPFHPWDCLGYPGDSGYVPHRGMTVLPVNLFW